MFVPIFFVIVALIVTGLILAFEISLWLLVVPAAILIMAIVVYRFPKSERVL